MSRPLDGDVRRLAAVWFADIVGYTSMAAEDENAALRLVKVLQSEAGEEVSAHGGRLVKVMGDAVLAEFNSNDAAVRAALGLQARFATAAEARGARLRIGVHVGDVVSTPDGDLYGDGINLASRVQGQAEPGQVVVTQDVWHQLRQRPDFRFDSIGERKLRGLTGRVWLFHAEMAVPGERGVAANASLPRRPPGRYARLARIALAYLVVSAVLFEGTAALRARLRLPEWVTPIASFLLLGGIAIILATAWVQSRPAWERRIGEQANPWRLDVGDLAKSVARRRLPNLTWARTLLGGVLAFSVLFGTAGAYVLLRQRLAPMLTPPPAVAQPGPALVILPFEASGAESDLWTEGVLDLLEINLNGAGGLRVIDPRTVLSRWREDEQVADSATAIRLAADVGAAYAVAGRVVATPERLTISADVYDRETGAILGRSLAGAPPDSLPQLLDRIGLDILRTGITPESREPPRPLGLGRLATSSADALRAYLAGIQEFRHSRWREAQRTFREAIQADSTFALALYRLSLAMSWSEQPHVPRPDRFGEAASRFAERLTDRDALLVRANRLLNAGSPDAVASLQQLTEHYPDDVEGWFLLGDAYYHLSGPDDRFRDALHHALRLDPTFGPAYLHLIEDAVERRDTTAARQLIADYRAVDPGSPLLTALALLLERERPEPGRPATEPEQPDRMETAYETTRHAADAARSAASAVGATAGLPAFARADSLRSAALYNAAAGRYAAARASMDIARTEYEDARAHAIWSTRLDSVRSTLEPLRDAAPATPETAEADDLVRQAAEAERAGRYGDALDRLRQAADRYERAGLTAQPAATQTEAPEPEPPVSASAIAADVLEALRRAIESKDVAAVRAVWVTLTEADARRFEDSFAIMRNLEVVFDILSVEQAGDELSVTARTTYEFFNETSRRPDRQRFTQTLHLARRGDRWVVVASRS